MGFSEILFIALGVAMDALAVSVCKGISKKEVSLRTSLINGLFFGGFQAIMPLIGFFLGCQFKDYILFINHWIAFILLTVIGINMILESDSNLCPVYEDSLNVKNMIVLSLATSVDALAVGLTFAILKVRVGIAILIIGVTTFILSTLGMKIGNLVGGRFHSKAETIGGIILIFMGTKILLEHLGIIG